MASRLTDGYAAAAPTLTRAVEMALAPVVGADGVGSGLPLAGFRPTAVFALEVWDAEASQLLAARQAQLARDAGALMQLRVALNYAAEAQILAGELTAAALMIEEDHLIAEATGNVRMDYGEMLLAAWRGEEARAVELIATTVTQAATRGLGRVATLACYASAVLDNGLGRHDAARDAARRAFKSDQMGFGPMVLPELAEAASRTGDVALVEAALEWLRERTRATPTDWARGAEAGIGALLSQGAVADDLYRESITRLGRTRVRSQLARAHLQYGEWLRRERRRLAAREELRKALEMFVAMGAEAFANRARRELLATGETVRKRIVETRSVLTPQEAQIARLARDGLSNPEIGTRLFISPRTVQYHLRKVFTKLDISSRSQLYRFLPRDPTASGRSEHR
jgi:DNA-binding CsgD family transcriptional regulator